MASENDLLGPDGRDKDDATPDGEFYRQARMVAHIDDGAIATLTSIYRELLTPLGPEAHVLDLMSSRYSHLPMDVELGEIAGLGMNAAELRANPQLGAAVVQDLNANPRMPFPNAYFGAVVCAVSVQYLTKPVAVFREVARILRPTGPFCVAFSNRMFPTKAIRAWRERDDEGHIDLVTGYFAAAGGFDAPQVIRHAGVAARWWGGGSDPLYAVIARKSAPDMVE
ncbi:MAG: methyltransferase domain-containing protein [Ktedonobacterales bacterium]|nr:methyltransferase domain-containing protein [Ktedonobacterales bacterium]